MNQNNFKNYGVLIREKSTDFRAGLVSGNLPYEVRSESGDYGPWLPPGEWQKSDNGDSMSCVSFGALNAIETEELRQTERQINYSDRWIAKMSGTTPQGNYLDKVLDTIRAYGLVKEESYPAPATYTWAEYHADIPEPLLSKLRDEGAEWLKKWEVNYEWVNISSASLVKHLKHGPLIVVVPGHLVMNWRVVSNIKDLFDSYAPFKKKAPGEYPNITYAMKIVLTPREKVDPDILFRNLEEGNWGSEVIKLKRALARIYPLSDNNKKDMSMEDPVDYYGEFTREWLWKFYKANLNRFSWAWLRQLYWHKGSEVGKDERDLINKILSKK
jgi:hypothetical protein